MERKAFHALLLSLAVIAGAMTITTDAHAQTNTERLMTVEDNTNNIIAALSGIADAITAGFAEVMAALGAIQGEVAATHSEVEAIHSEVDALSDTVDGLDDQIGAVNSAISAAAASLGQPDPAVAAIAADVADIAEGVQTNSVSINAITDKLAEVDTMLASIAESVGVVQETVETAPATQTVPATGLMKGKTEYTVKVEDFGDSVAQGDAPMNNAYTVVHSLSCEAPVSVDDASVTQPRQPFNAATAGAGDDGADDGDADTFFGTTITSGVHTLFNPRLATGSATTPTVSYHQPIDFDLVSLATGSDIKFMSVTAQGGVNMTTIPGSQEADGNVQFAISDYVNTDFGENVTDDGTNFITRIDAGDVELYTITVNWLSAAADPKCTISSSSGTSAGLTETDEEVLVSVTATGAGILKDYSATVDCGHQPTMVTNIRVEGVGSLQEYFTLNLEAGDEELSLSSSDDENRLDIDTTTGVITADNLRFEFDNSELIVSGKVAGVSAIIQLTYDTVDDNECEVVMPDAGS